MSLYVAYYAGGYNQAAAAGNAREVWDIDARTYTAYDQQGNQTTQRAFTAPENAQADAWVQQSQQQSNGATLRQQAGTALSNNQTYLGLGTPTNAQVVAQVAALTRQMDGVIRLVIGQLDATG